MAIDTAETTKPLAAAGAAIAEQPLPHPARGRRTGMRLKPGLRARVGVASARARRLRASPSPALSPTGGSSDVARMLAVSSSGEPRRATPRCRGRMVGKKGALLAGGAPPCRG